MTEKLSDPALANYGKVLPTYKVNSAEFIKQWQEINTIDAGHFGELQDEYMLKVYYGAAMEKWKKIYFNAEKHSDAMKTVIFARAVQNGVSGCTKLFERMAKKLGQQNLNYVSDS